MKKSFCQEVKSVWRLQGRLQEGAAHPVEMFGSAAEIDVQAEVPGNIEDALTQGGIVPDPYFGCNSRELRKYEFYEWVLSTDFDCTYEGKNPLELVFHGVDLLGTVFLNGEKIGQCRNAFLPHRFAATLKRGKNHLSVYLSSVGRELETLPFNAGAFAGGICFNYENMRFRRPGHETGWDIAPRMALGGLFRAITVEEKLEHRFVEAFLQTLSVSDDEKSALLRLSFHAVTPLLGDPDVMLTVDGECGNSTFHGERILWSSQGCVTFRAADPLLWQIRHYGRPNLYRVFVRLVKKGEILAEKEISFGIRTVKLLLNPVVTAGDKPDFQFLINDRPVRLIGLNHVPADALHSHDAARLPGLLEKFDACGVNAIRVWGGGIYEPDFFYDFCDRKGIFVWQDFMMACGQYPNDRAFLETIESEAETVVRMLRQHPSIGLWCGDNECDMVPTWSDLPADPNKNLITRKVLPEVCRRHDPLRPFLPSSPYYSPEAVAAAKGGDPLPFAPEQHLWGDRGYFKNAFYRHSRASFVSETGYHGAAAAESIRKFLPPECCYPLENPAGYMHATNANYPYDLTNNYRIGVMQKQIDSFFAKVPQNLDDFCQASQIVQMEAVKFLIENYRFNPKCSGLILWNLADCWPECSDAVCDYYGTPKLAYYLLPALCAPVLFTLTDEGKLCAVNDTFEVVSGVCRVSRQGVVVKELSFTLEKESITELAAALPPDEACAPGVVQLEWRLADGSTGRNHALLGRPLFDYAHFCREYLPEIMPDKGNE